MSSADESTFDETGIGDAHPAATNVPVVGRIAAGGPILAEEQVTDVFPLPKQLVGDGTLFLLRVLCGLDHREIGLEHLPKGPAIIAAKHQSAWETLFLSRRLGNEPQFQEDARDITSLQRTWCRNWPPCA